MTRLDSRMLRSSFFMFLAYSGGTILSFLRNILIARSLSVEDFGIVGTLSIGFAIIEMAIYTGLDRLLVQDKDGGTEAFQDNLQGLQLIRGVIGGVGFFLFAWPYTWFLGNTDILWAYLALAGLPVIRGFVHFDLFRRQRDMSFGPTVLVTVVGPAFALIAAAVSLLFMESFSVMLITMYVQQIMFVAATHMIAKRRWRISWNWDTTRKAIHFGLPLWANGILVFLIHSGDSLLVGSLIGMEALGWFYVGTLITLTASMNFDHSLGTTLLPRMSRVQDERLLFAQLAREALEYSVAAALLLILGVHLFGSALVLLLFGIDYSPLLPILSVMAVMYGIKTAKIAPNVQALAQGQSALPMISNLPRGVSFFAAFGILSLVGGNVATILSFGVISESTCLVLAMWLATRPGRGLSIVAAKLPLSILGLGVGLTLLDTWWRESPTSLADTLDPSRLHLAIGLIVLILALPAIRKMFRT